MVFCLVKVLVEMVSSVVVNVGMRLVWREVGSSFSNIVVGFLGERFMLLGVVVYWLLVDG